LPRAWIRQAAASASQRNLIFIPSGQSAALEAFIAKRAKALPGLPND
jgi:hypothetical protein